jgi:glycosyltransferase involved in cell wall biosynthesis
MPSTKKYTYVALLILTVLAQSTCLIFPSDEEPRVLILRLRKRGTVEWGGVATHTLTLYKSLLQIGVKAHILVPADSPPAEQLKDQNLPFFTFKGDDTADDTIKDIGDPDINCEVPSPFYLNYLPSISNEESLFSPYEKKSLIWGNPDSLYDTALDICKNYKINIIHVNFVREMQIAKKICKSLEGTQKISIVSQQHGLPTSYVDYLAGASAFISTNKRAIQLVQEKKLGIKCIKLLPPMTQFKTNQTIDENLSKKAFFKKRFGITIHPSIPILCCVAHFFNCKNHENLFKAIHKLTHTYKIPIQLMLAGDGKEARIHYLKRMAKHLRIQKNVYFLGFVTNIQEFLFYSDIKVLVSKKEPFALAAIEAALMKKPMVISKNAGVTDTFILHKKTGLLCDPYSVKNIAQQIKYLIENPSLAKKLGEAAFTMVSKYYLEKGLIQEYVNVYEEVLKDTAETTSLKAI